jgi:hypothetical protein
VLHIISSKKLTQNIIATIVILEVTKGREMFNFITATLTVERTIYSANVSGEVYQGPEFIYDASLIISECLQVLTDNIIVIGGVGSLGFLFEPGVGISIDVRKYDVSKLLAVQQEDLMEQVCILENSPLSTTDGDMVPVGIKIDIEVI